MRKLTYCCSSNLGNFDGIEFVYSGYPPSAEMMVYIYIYLLINQNQQIRCDFILYICQVVGYILEDEQILITLTDVRCVNVLLLCKKDSQVLLFRERLVMLKSTILSAFEWMKRNLIMLTRRKEKPQNT